MAENSVSPFAEVRLRHRIGALALDVNFNLTQPWTILFGPSGSGKTTVLRAMAGLVRPDASRILLGARTMVDSDTKAFVPAHQRPTRVAAQQTALFPHMTVSENIAYGVSDGAAANFAETIIEQFRLGELARMIPAKLSGGERQRVAVARAAASAINLGDQAILLLDEPFTGMDAKLRDELIADLQHLLAKSRIPVLSVTHDVAEAFQLGAEVIKIAEGKVIEQGPVEVVLAQERLRLLDQLGVKDADRIEASNEPFLSG